MRKDIQLTGSPLVLWDYAAERRADIISLTARDLFQLLGSNPYTATFGEERDISNLCQFGWYEWVYFYESHRNSHEEERDLSNPMIPKVMHIFSQRKTHLFQCKKCDPL